jgi:hypothetical protein
MNTLVKLLTLAAVGLTVFHTAGASAEPVGPRGPSIMIVGEDADKDTIPRGNRNFNRILRAVTENLVTRGFKVYDETAITMNILPQGGVRRLLPELLETAKLAQAPIDVIVVFQIYASVRPLLAVRDTFRPVVRVDGRMIRVRGGQDLGGYEFGSDIELPPIPGVCVNGDPPRECLLESFGNEARLIGSAVGNALATKLAGYLRADFDPGLLPPGLPPGPPPGVVPGGPGPVVVAPGPVPVEGRPICDGLDGTPYVLRIANFDGPELNRLEEAFTGFACYEHHRIVRSQPGMTDYWYETRADQARLTRNLRFVLEYMNLPGTVSVTSGNMIIVEKHLLAPHGVVTVPPGTR